MELTKVRLQIAGSNYVISTTDSESYVHELAERLDKDMKDILESAPSASVTQAAVLAALDYLDELQKSTGSVDNMRRQIKDYLEDAANAKSEAADAKRQVQELQRRRNEFDQITGSWSRCREARHESAGNFSPCR